MIFAQQKMKYDMYVQASKKAFLKMCKTSESNILVTNMIWQMQSVLAPPHLLLLKRKSERCDNASQGTFDFEFSRSKTRREFTFYVAELWIIRSQLTLLIHQMSKSFHKTLIVYASASVSGNNINEKSWLFLEFK